MHRSSGIAFLLWCSCFVGVAGIHRIYLGRYVTGIIWLFTFGLLGVGQFIDLFLINGMTRRANREEAYDLAIDDSLLRGAAHPR